VSSSLHFASTSGSLPDHGAFCRDAETIRVGDHYQFLPVFEQLQLSNLVIAAIAFGNDDRVAGA
jgi:hypothetical protein